jgi:uncharacterized protein with FMN-binding domain
VHSIAGSVVSNRFGDNQVRLVLNGKIQDVRYPTDRPRSARSTRRRTAAAPRGLKAQSAQLDVVSGAGR